jgi:molybdopterin/thiamine biosynthesis adenylyltransferase
MIKLNLGNLNRQTLFNLSDIGKFKVIQAKKKLKKFIKK